jgi:sulfur carrier protein
MRINGKETPFLPGTVADLLLREGYSPAHVVVELGRRIITREQFAQTKLREEDEVNVLQFMGGG